MPGTLHRSPSQGRTFSFFSFLILTSLFLGAAAGSSSARDVSFTILFTNDQHGQLEPLAQAAAGQPVGGAARRMALIEKIRTELGPKSVVLVDGGDMFTGGALSGLTRGEADCAAYKLMRYDAVALGNHDFDYGKKTLLDYQSRKRFGTPWVSANLVVPGNHQNFVHPYVIRSVPGLRIGLIGFSNPDTPHLTRAENVQGLMFQSAGASAKGIHSILKKDADIFVALSHLGLDQDKVFAKDNPFLHVIVGGHSHDLLTEPIVDRRKDGGLNGPLIVQAGSRGLYLGRLDLTVTGRRDPKTRKENFVVSDFHYQAIPLTADLPEDPRMVQLLADYRAKTAYAKLDETIVLASGRIPGSDQGDSVIGEAAADAVRAASKADAAMVNSGSFRSDLRAGPVTRADLFEVIPFEDETVLLDVTGYTLRRVLEDSALKRGQGGFLQLSGLTVSKEGATMKVMVGSEPLRERQRYKVAVNDFLAGGGDGYAVLRSVKSRERTGSMVRDLLEGALKAKGKISPEDLDKRWGF